MVGEGGIRKILNEYKSKFKINVCNVAIVEKILLYNGQNIFDSTLCFKFSWQMACYFLWALHSTNMFAHKVRTAN